MDEKLVILVQNCPPSFQMTIYAQHQSDDGHSYEAFAHFTASTSGSVNGLCPFEIREVQEANVS